MSEGYIYSAIGGIIFFFFGMLVRGFVSLAWGKVTGVEKSITELNQRITTIETSIALLDRQDREFKDAHRLTIGRIHERIDEIMGKVDKSDNEVRDLEISILKSRIESISQ